MSIESKKITLQPTGYTTEDLIPLERRLENLMQCYNEITLIVVIDYETYNKILTDDLSLVYILQWINRALCSGYAVTYHYTVT